MGKNIKIDIENIDTRTVTSQERLLQNEAYKRLRKILSQNLSDISSSQEILECRSHNTIFINGKRGSGKTQFILSIKSYLNDTKKRNKELSENFYIFNPIDPTLLHDNESFLTIIIAKVLNNLETNNMLKKLNDFDKKNFYEILNNLSNAIDGVINRKNEIHSSLESIAQDQTSLKLEQYVHDFFELTSKIVEKKRLILLIDDVDMAFDKGFEVLEVIRKYLSTPYVVPIVTGDIELYNIIINDNFNKKLEHSKNNDEKIKTVTTDYLIKVFPTNRRIKLKTLYDLYYDNLEKKVKSEISFIGCSNYKNITSLFKSMLKNDNFAIMEGKSFEQFKRNLLENSLRRLTQFFNANKEKELFNLIKINDLIHIENDYFLNLLNKVNSYHTFLEGGIEALTNKDDENAIKYFLNAVENTHNSEEKANAYFLLGNAYASSKELEKAHESYENSIHYNQNNVRAYFNLGNINVLLNNNQNAISYYEKTIELNPELDIAYYHLGNIYFNEEEYDNAIKMIEKAISLNSKNSQYFNDLAECYSEKHDFHQAEILFKKAIELAPEDEQYYNNLGQLYISNNKEDEAIKMLKRSIKINPKNAETYSALGTSFYYKGEKEQALEYLHKSVELNKSNSKSYNFIGAINLMEGNPKDAISYFEQALIINPNDEEWIDELCTTYIIEKEYNKAINQYEKLLIKNPDNSDYWNNLGYAYLQLKHFEKAKEILEKAIEINSENFISYINLISLDLINDNFIKSKYVDDFVERFKEYKSGIKLFELLNIIYKVSNGVDISILEKWKQDFKDVKNDMIFSFDNIKEWAEVKNNKKLILKCIDAFESN